MSNEIAKTDAVTGLCTQLEKSFCQALPTHVTKEHFSRALQTAFRKTPALMQCDGKTIAESVLTAAQLGLMIGVNGQCWLLPYGKECQLIIGYQGLVDLVYRSNLVDSIRANVVCENDEFDYEEGLDTKLRHKVNLKGERGKPYAVYAIAEIKGSSKPTYIVMGSKEVISVKGSSKAAGSKYSPWNGEFEAEMWKKTAVRRLCKLLPKSTEIISALDFENKQEEKIREAEAYVVDDDPLAPGKRSTRKQAQQPKQEQEAQPIDEREELIQWISGAVEHVGKIIADDFCERLKISDFTEATTEEMKALKEEYQKV